LIRDINDDLVQNQQTDEFKVLSSTFSQLLNGIILTVNRFGLKQRFLSRHKKQVKSFFKEIKALEYDTEVCSKWKKRFLLSQDELFTFMNYDGIPWNNNNAETAIKAIALYRRNTEGIATRIGIQEYLPLLSIHQTCKYRGINFFEFLKSREKSISKYSEKHK
jgi:hypothetical protein